MSEVKRGAEANYSTMSISDIKQIPVNDLADPSGAVLVLWTPSSLLQEGLDVMKAWGFAQKQTYIWSKTKIVPLEGFKKMAVSAAKKIYDLEPATRKGQVLNLVKRACMDSMKEFVLENTLAFGMGRLFRQTHEICLIGINDKGIYKKLNNKSQRSVSFGEVLKHSSKPEHLQDSLELMFPKTEKIELFARRLRSGWTCVGNEICNGEDIRVSLSKL